MPSMDERVSSKDKISIYWTTGLKALRGLRKKIFLKKSKGLLFVGKKATITHGNSISVGRNVKFEAYSEVQGLSRHGLHFGDNVTIGRFTSIRPSSYYGVGQLGWGLEMGDNSSIGPYGYIGCSGKVIIGKKVMIGPRVSLFAENHVFSQKNMSIKSQGVKNTGITIEDDCWIGSGVIILDGVHIGKGCVIGAGTLIAKDIPEYSIVMDKRSKVIKGRI
ncbi:acyltransferase [Lactobacillus equicursoris]|uniref:acyltransferase n=1 Tax=Lactobacillus equicursoris TaxID=420645 RepID=UPI0039954487